MIKNSTLKPGEDKKLKPTYKGPYLVSKVLNKNRYVIQDILGFNSHRSHITQFFLLID